MIEKLSQFELGRFLDTIESAPPASVVDVFAAELTSWLGTNHVRFLITDLSGNALVPLGGAPETDLLDVGRRDVLMLDDHRVHRRALITQRVQVLNGGGATTFI